MYLSSVEHSMPTRESNKLHFANVKVDTYGSVCNGQLFKEGGINMCVSKRE